MVLWRYLKNASLLSGIAFLSACSGGDGGNGIGVGNSSIALSWVAPTARADETALPLSDIAGYRIYYGVEKGVYRGQMSVDDSSATQATVSGIPSGLYFVVMATLDHNGLRSEYSPALQIAAK